MKKAFSQAVFVASTFTVAVCWGQDDSAVLTRRVENALTNLQVAIEKHDWTRSEAESAKLLAFGPDAIQFLVSELKKNAGSKAYRLELVNAVARVDAEKGSTEALVDLALTHPDPDIATTAGNWIDNRIIDIPLTEKQLTTLIERINSDTGMVGAQWAYALARATHVDGRRLVEPTVQAFKAAIQDSKEKPIRFYPGSYFSDEVAYLNRFVRAFSFMKAKLAVPALKREVISAADARTRLWLVIASGAAGDEGVGEELLECIHSETVDASTRAAALSAYAKALKTEAISVLETYLADASVGPNPRFPPLAIVAHSELAKLRRRQ